MPELPEVETVRRGLDTVVGRRIVSATVGRDRVVRRTSAQHLIDGVTGVEITAVQRWGKYLVVRTSGDRRVMIHLRMSGQVLITSADSAPPAHTHVRMVLDDHREIRFVDPRTFGEVVAYRAQEESEVVPELARLGPDPVVDGVATTYVAAAFAGRRRRLKDALLDQSVIAGIGNIYGDEICHAARLSPLRPVGSVNRRGIGRLTDAIHSVLADAVAAGGSTLGDAQYVGVDGAAGTFQNHHRVYGRTGLRCHTCGRGLIRRTVVSQRSTHHCPVCQR